MTQPSYVTDRSATVNGLVWTTEGGETSYWVEYGQTTAYGHESSHRSASVADDTPHRVSVPIAGLSANRSYHYRLCAEDAQAGTCSVDATLTTGRPGTGRSGIAVTSDRDGNFEVYVMDADGSDQTRLTNNSATDDRARWSPDGSKLAFRSTRDDNHEIYVMDADGANQTNLTNNEAFDLEPAWSPDRSKIAFASFRAGTYDVFVMDPDGSNPTNLTSRTGSDFDPAWSPDGGKLAFVTDRDGNLEVYMMDADGSDQTRLTHNTARDLYPAWSPRP